uniref:Thioredoxin domain-containing protein n=1 Tax=Auxenochlorella protothecoides TaxID=3075 RepID=A0A1D2A8Q7_AUXPR
MIIIFQILCAQVVDRRFSGCPAPSTRTSMGLRACVLLAIVTALLARSHADRVLADGFFEHKTQAATGQTTGTWAVLFYESLPEEPAALGEFEALTQPALEHQIFLARVDISTNPQLRHRFRAVGSPAVVLFRHQKMYRYEGTLSRDSFLHWATEAYEASPGAKVPQPPPAFRLLMEPLYSYVDGRVGAAVGVLVGAAILVTLLAARHERDRKRKPRWKQH